MINRSFKNFKFQHKRNLNQVLFTSKNIKGDAEILNLIDNFLNEKNSFIFESVEKGIVKGRYTIFGKKPDKIWEFNNNKSYSINKNNKKKRIRGNPKKIIENLIENFKFKTPSSLPPICSLLSGYFSYDSIRYIEKIPNSCIDDLKLPDVRLLRPKILIIHDTSYSSTTNGIINDWVFAGGSIFILLGSSTESPTTIVSPTSMTGNASKRLSRLSGSNFRTVAWSSAFVKRNEMMLLHWLRMVALTSEGRWLTIMSATPYFRPSLAIFSNASTALRSTGLPSFLGRYR